MRWGQPGVGGEECRYWHTGPRGQALGTREVSAVSRWGLLLNRQSPAVRKASARAPNLFKPACSSRVIVSLKRPPLLLPCVHSRGPEPPAMAAPGYRWVLLKDGEQPHQHQHGGGGGGGHSRPGDDLQ